MSVCLIEQNKFKNYGADFHMVFTNGWNDP